MKSMKVGSSRLTTYPLILHAAVIFLVVETLVLIQQNKKLEKAGRRSFEGTKQRIYTAGWGTDEIFPGKRP